MNIFWPPGYYILRDRIPFFLSLIYFHRNRFPKITLDLMGAFLTVTTGLLTGSSVFLYLIDNDMRWITGIQWSPSSPIQWGTLIFVSTIMLYSRKLGIFESYYVALLAALGGGWLYECHGWILDPNLMAFFKINAVKVFFMEFQLFCIPIILYLIKTRYEYKQNRWLIPITVFGVLFYASTPWIKPLFPMYVGYYAYRWYIRLPTIAWLFTLLYGIKGEKIQ